MRRFIYRTIIFALPVILTFCCMELYLRSIPNSVSKKQKFIAKNKSEIEIIALGSSHYERGINPAFLDYTTINFGNSGQRVYENYQLFNHFKNEFSNLKLIIIELSYDWLERDKSMTPEIIDHENLVFFDTNTFNRNTYPWDYSLFLSNTDYYSKLLLDSFGSKSDFDFNEYGYDQARFYGSYQAANYDEQKIRNTDIYLENANNYQQFKKNAGIFKRLIRESQKINLQVLIYNTPSHFRYNELRNDKVIRRRDSLLLELKKEFPSIKILDDETNRDFRYQDFYNADHLNPDGARKATKRLNNFIKKNYSFD